MKNKLLQKLDSGYKWTYCSLGGETRVKISNGEDIAHLGELDQKLWTTLACPVNGLEFDQTTLDMLDTDGDGKIRVKEIVAAAQWLTSVIKNKDLILEGSSTLPISEINTGNPDGERLALTAKHILEHLKLEKDSISIEDTIEACKVLSEAAAKAVSEPSEDALPYGEDTEAIYEACCSLKAKVEDYFLRCRMIAFDADASEVLDVSTDSIKEISSANLADKLTEISGFPLARPNTDAVLPFDGINPAWQSVLAKIQSVPEFKSKKGLTQDDWNKFAAKFETFQNWLQVQKNVVTDRKLVDALAKVGELNKLLHYFRDFYKILNNFVFFGDFYSVDANQKAIFETGDLYIDQRCCKLCIKVQDMAAHADMSKLSGMFLIYCHCTSKTIAQEMDIVAVMTAGGINNLRPGTNAVFYDRQGVDWDATVTKIVDNPISIGQAFLTPYRKLGDFITEKITKNASDKEAAAISALQNRFDKPALDPNAHADAKAASKNSPFDIAKFAGIFAAIGMALGYIGAFLTSVVSGVTSNPLKALIVLVAVLLCISLPSCILAWLKLRKRNLGPVLNANGWAINSVILVNIVFGATLTSMAKYPKLNLEDPFKEKKMPFWKKALCILVPLLLIAAALYFSGCLESLGLNFGK